MNNNSPHITDSLLAKFLLGEASLTEQQEVQAWLEKSDNNSKYLDQMEFIWLESGKLDPKPIDVNVDKAWAKVDGQIQAKTISMRYIYIGIAASIALLFGLFGVYHALFQTSAPQYILANQTESALVDSLPDGSVITLAQNAEIEYEYNSKSNARIAKLKGEAFFNVSRDTTKQFIVDVGFGGVQVLGTSFNIKPQNSTNIRVDVLSGTVRLYYIKHSNDTLFLTLTKGESATLSTELDSLFISPQSGNAFFHINKTLLFSGVPLNKVFETIENCYNVEIVCNDNIINDLLFTANFINDDVESIFEVIANTFNLTYTSDNNTYTIEKINELNILEDSSDEELSD